MMDIFNTYLDNTQDGPSKKDWREIKPLQLF